MSSAGDITNIKNAYGLVCPSIRYCCTPGSQCPPGPQGPQGPSGEQGIQGIQGPSGGTFGGYYASFSCSQTIGISGENIPRAIYYNTTDISSPYIRYDTSNPSRIVFDVSGAYIISYSIEFDKPGGQQDDIYVWLRFNGTDVPRTSSIISLKDNNVKTFPYIDYIIQVTAAGQYVECMFASANTQIVALAVPPTTLSGSGYIVPAVPSIITNVYRIG